MHEDGTARHRHVMAIEPSTSSHFIHDMSCADLCLESVPASQPAAEASSRQLDSSPKGSVCATPAGAASGGEAGLQACTHLQAH